jgi:hypothetical protein
VTDEPLAIGKAERQRALIESIVAGQQPESSSARAQLERLLGPDELARLDELLLELLTDKQGEVEPEPAFFDALFAHQAEKRLRLRDALLGHGRTEETTTTTTTENSFDGGARGTPPQPPPSHEQTLIALLRSGDANAGASF